MFHVWVRICLTITIHWPGGYHIRCSLDRNGSFLIDGWFYLVWDSIRSKIHQHIFKSPDWCFICWWHHLPHHTENFVSVFTGNCVFAFSHMFEFYYIWIYFIPPMFRVFSIFSSQCAPPGSVEQSTNTFFSRLAGAQFTVCRPASSHRYFWFRFTRQLHFPQFIYILVYFCLCLRLHS